MAFSHSQVSYSRIPLSPAHSSVFQSNKRNCTVAYEIPEALLELSPASRDTRCHSELPCPLINNNFIFFLLLEVPGAFSFSLQLSQGQLKGAVEMSRGVLLGEGGL